jgi:hypothetical protein
MPLTTNLKRYNQYSRLEYVIINQHNCFIIIDFIYDMSYNELKYQTIGALFVEKHF